MELADVKRQLKLLEQRKAKGWAVRAMLKCAAEGDLPEKYYFSRLKQQRHRSTIPMLPDHNGRVTQTQAELQSVIQNHFKNFLKGEAEAPDWQSC